MFDLFKEKVGELASKAGEIADNIQEKAEGLKESFGKTITITADQNFMRILAVKTPFPEGFCFDGGKPVETLMIDWFQPLDQISNKFPLTIKESAIAEKHQSVADFVKNKDYYKFYKDQGYIILGITNYECAFII